MSRNGADSKSFHTWFLGALHKVCDFLEKKSAKDDNGARAQRNATLFAHDWYYLIDLWLWMWSDFYIWYIFIFIYMYMRVLCALFIVACYAMSAFYHESAQHLTPHYQRLACLWFLKMQSFPKICKLIVPDGPVTRRSLVLFSSFPDWFFHLSFLFSLLGDIGACSLNF